MLVMANKKFFFGLRQLDQPSSSFGQDNQRTTQRKICQFCGLVLLLFFSFCEICYWCWFSLQ